MNKAAAIAATRFGFGPNGQEDYGDDPRGALKAELQGPDPGLASGNFASLMSGGEAVDMLRDNARQRKALLNAPQADRDAFNQQKAKPYQDEQAAQLAWAIATPASFRERLVWFWANHFSVSASQNEAGLLIGPLLREAIRPNVTGNFTDMVLAVERHPAMLRYLANDASVGPDSRAGRRMHRGLNENLGRECMELHTLSLAAGYTQTDVTCMANILTGWSIAPSDQGADATGFLYRPNWHEPGPQTVLGQEFDGGEQAGIDALTYFSTYPTTLQNLAKKLVTHFVSDDPPPAAVAHIAGVLRDSQGDLAATSAALVDLPQAWVQGQKFKTPFEYVVSALRAAPPPPAPKPVNIAGAIGALGQPVWNAPLPNGWPDQAAVWAASDAVLARIDWAFTYAGRFDQGFAGPQPADIANLALGPLLRPATQRAIAQAGSRREALTLLFAAPEFMRR